MAVKYEGMTLDMKGIGLPSSPDPLTWEQYTRSQTPRLMPGLLILDSNLADQAVDTPALRDQAVIEAVLVNYLRTWKRNVASPGTVGLITASDRVVLDAPTLTIPHARDKFYFEDNFLLGGTGDATLGIGATGKASLRLRGDKAVGTQRFFHYGTTGSEYHFAHGTTDDPAGSLIDILKYVPGNTTDVSGMRLRANDNTILILRPETRNSYSNYAQVNNGPSGGGATLVIGGGDSSLPGAGAYNLIIQGGVLSQTYLKGTSEGSGAAWKAIFAGTTQEWEINNTGPLFTPGAGGHLGFYDRTAARSVLVLGTDGITYIRGSLDLNGNVDANGNDITELDELHFNDAGADPTAAGRARRNGVDLKWHDGTAARQLLSTAPSQISALTEKASPVSADLLIIEDSAASNAKKKVQIGNLPSSGAPAGSQYLTLAFDAGLSGERLFTPSDGLSATDGGANGNYTLKSKSFTIDVDDGNTIGDTTVETTISSISVPAATLDANEQLLHYRALINWRWNGSVTDASLVIRIKFAGLTLATFTTGVYTAGGTAQGFVQIDVHICRTSATTASIQTWFIGNDNAGYTWQDYSNETLVVTAATDSAINYDDDFAVTWANANTFSVTGQWGADPSSTGNNPTVELHHGMLEKIAA